MSNLRDMPESHRRIIEFLAEQKTTSKYQLANKLKISYSTVYEVIELLISKELVKIVEEKKFKTGLIKRMYSLTENGVKLAVQLSTNWDEKLRIAEKWEHLLSKNTVSWIRFLRFMKDKMLQTIFNIDVLDYKTKEFNFVKLFVDHLLITSKKENQVFNEILNYPDPTIKNNVIEEMKSRIKIREKEIEQCKKIIGLLRM